MSSVDSSLLSGASYITRNIFRHRTKSEGSSDSPLGASRTLLTFRLSTVALATAAVALSLSTSTIYGLWQLAG